MPVNLVRNPWRLQELWHLRSVQFVRIGWVEVQTIHSQLFPTVAIRCFTEIIFVLASWLPSKLPAVWRCDQRGCRPVSPNSALRITLRTGGR